MHTEGQSIYHAGALMAIIDSLSLPEGMKLPKQTVAWFEAWRRDPITRSWGEAQCQFLVDTALVHAAVWGMGRFDLAHELMMREREMGVRFDPMVPSGDGGESGGGESTLHVIQGRRRERRTG